VIDRRSFLAAAAAVIATRSLSAKVWTHRHAQRPGPSPSQLTWQRDELALFCHFGVNTFTDREWGDGNEDPAIFAPARLDARQWARAAKAGGFRSMILTAKHHDGFCLWPSATTQHSVAASPWRGGQGDVVREFVDAARAEGLRAGLYLSPWDRNSPAYGDSPRYNDLYCAQLTELLTRYGSLAEVWFDGANGEGPNGKRQVYDWPRVFALVRRFQPDAVIFSDAGPDIRWCGNENGAAGDPNWSAVDPTVVPFPGASGPTVESMLLHGDPLGSVWRPAEADVSIRPGWFHHPAEDARVKTVDRLADLYFSSVGRNSKLLLNVPPTRDGVLHDTDVARLAGFRERLSAMFANDEAAAAPARWRSIDASAAELEVDLGRAVNVSVARMEEPIATGQTVSSYELHGEGETGWRPISRGTTIGYARLDRFTPVNVRRIRLRITGAIDTPQRVTLQLFGEAR
jgi:alpha-L-fucosidase